MIRLCIPRAVRNIAKIHKNCVLDSESLQKIQGFNFKDSAGATKLMYGTLKNPKFYQNLTKIQKVREDSVVKAVQDSASLQTPRYSSSLSSVLLMSDDG